MVNKSRYKNAKPFVGEDGASPVFLGHRPRAIGVATGVVEHIVTEGERLDELARHYYNDDRLWWRIVDANPEVLYGGDLVQSDNYSLATMVGQVIRIPRGRE